MWFASCNLDKKLHSPENRLEGPRGRRSFMRYAVVVEKAEHNYSAYVPDLPGCVAAAETKEELLDLIREAIDFHLEGMRAAGEEIPEPTAVAEYVEIQAVPRPWRTRRCGE
jgi:predicted RNase H-like HicB family nuclease